MYLRPAARESHREGKLVTLRTSTYKYRYVKVKKGRKKGSFKRKIVKVKVAVGHVA